MPRLSFDDLPALLSPLLDGTPLKDGEVLDGVTLVAERLAALGIPVTSGGRPLPGITDEVAVVTALGHHHRILTGRGQFAAAGDVASVIRRVAKLTNLRYPTLT